MTEVCWVNKRRLRVFPAGAWVGVGCRVNPMEGGLVLPPRGQTWISQWLSTEKAFLISVSMTCLFCGVTSSLPASFLSSSSSFFLTWIYLSNRKQVFFVSFRASPNRSVFTLRLCGFCWMKTLQTPGLERWLSTAAQQCNSAPTWQLITLSQGSNNLFCPPWAPGT